MFPDDPSKDPASDSGNVQPTESAPHASSNPDPGESKFADVFERVSASGAAGLKTSWLHPTSLIFELLSHSRELVLPVGIAIFSAANGSRNGLILAFVFFVPAVIYSVFRYFTLRYRISDGELVVKQGLVFRQIRTVPIGRVQNIDLVQNLLHRLFRVAEVRIETASGTEPEATLRVLSMQKIAELRAGIFEHPTNRVTSNDPEHSETGALSANASVHDSVDASPLSASSADNRVAGISLLEIPSWWLVKAGLASNRGLLMVGIGLGAWYQFGLDDKIDFDRLKAFLPEFDGTLASGLIIAGLVLAGLVLLRLLGVLWFLLRFFGYRLTLHGEDIRIICGLFTRVSATIPRKRIQFISIHRPLIMRWFKLASIRIETAGGGGQADNATTTISRRWFVPVIPENRIGDLIVFLRPGLAWQETALDWQPLSVRAPRRLKRIAVIQALLISLTGFFLTWIVATDWHPWGFLPGVLLLPINILWAGKKARAMRYARTDQMIVYRSGVLDRKTSMTFYDKVQTVSLGQSPFDRRWGMASLNVDTAAAGPAEHLISIRFLDDQFASNEHTIINQISSRYQPDFG